MTVAGAFREILDLLLPAGCIACGSWMPGPPRGKLVCGACRSRLRPPPWPRCPRCHNPLGTGRAPAPVCWECRDWPPCLTYARSAYLLESPADDLVHALKYDGWAELAGEMARDMAAVSLPREALGDGACVVPVPTTARRVSHRGYNQAELLARDVATSLGRPLVHALERPREGATQVALHPSERRANVRGAFVPSPGPGRSLRDGHVVLVDDVLTTGSTAMAAASTLVDLGASGVTSLTFARALPFRRDGAG